MAGNGSPRTTAAKPAAAERCLHELLEAHAASNPDAPAVSYGDLTLTYAALNTRANALAAQLLAAGALPDQPVGLCMDRSPELIVGIFGILKAGAAYVPLDPAYPPERLAHVLDQAAPQIIVSRAPLFASLPVNSAQLLDIETARAGGADNPCLDVSPDNLCYLIFTSGSTGLPKGVMVSHRNVVRIFTTLAPELKLDATDTWSLFHSYAFGFSAWEIFGALLHGAHLVIVPDEVRGDPQALGELLRDRQVTVVSQTPTAFRQALAGGSFDMPGLALRLVVLSGEPVVATDLARWFEQHAAGKPHLINTYAITETGGQVALRIYTDPGNAAAGASNIGTPLRDTPVWILDQKLEPVAAGETGELCVGGPGISRGYLNEPVLTAERFPLVTLDGSSQRIYRTGDMARRLASGEIEFVGRTDNQVKVRGHRVELGDIENCIGAHADVAECAVVLRADSGAEPRLVAYAVPVSGRTLDVSGLRRHAEAGLPDYMVPAVFVFMDDLPVSPNGKLDRAALPAPGSARPELATRFRAPTTPFETSLANIWATALGLDEVGLDDDFFELGGDSMLALKLTTGVRALLGEYVYISALLEAPTVATLSARLTAEYPAAAATVAAGDTATAATMQLPAVIPHHAERYAEFPLTDIQQAYLVGRGDDFAMGNVATHLYIEIDAVDLDLPRLERAWQRVIDRHPMLRAIVLPDGTQRILPEVPDYRFPLQDLSNLDAVGVEAGLLAERERLSHQVIPSDRWPLFELAASRLPANKTRLHISLDCLITDARSFQIMSGELLTFYHDEQAELPLPALTFRDYVLAERRLRDTPFFDNALTYWRERITTLPPMPQLPLACAPETLHEHSFVQRGRELGKAEWARLQQRAARAGITPTVVLLQCFGEALAAWSRSPQLTLNLTLFNRLPLHPEVDDVIGDFTSLVLLGISDLNTGSFEQRAQRLQKELWQGVDNRFVSGIRVMREIAQLGDKVQPMMPIVFTSTLGIGAGGQDSMSWHRLGEQVYSVSQTPQVWIDHVASERDGALWYTWDVVEALFPAGMIDELFAAYDTRLRELASAEAAWERSWVDTLDLTLPASQAQMRAAANATAGAHPERLLHEGFAAQAAADPAATAVIASDRTLSYGELDELSNRLAHRLLAAGVRRNQLVAVVMQKGWEQVVAVLGVLKAGGAYMPVDASMPTERLHYLLDFGEVRVAVTQICQDAAIDWPADTERVRISDDELAQQPVTAPPCATQPDDIAYVIFTSGSTGQPKGVVIDHLGATNTCDDINQRFAVAAADRVLALSSLSFDLSVYDIFGMLAAGGALVFPDAAGMRDPSHWANLVARHRVTIWNTVPALMDLLTDYAEQQAEPVLESLRVVMMSGDWIPVRLPDRIRALGTIDVYSLGGATEASIWSIIYPIGTVPPDWISIPYGKPMVNQAFHVLNPDLAPCPDWVAGDLYIGGIGLAKGYWRDAEKTAASFITHPRTGERLYRTGDMGRYLPDGNIEFMGREDFQVKVQGFRVELGDIEAALEAHPDIRNAVVVATGEDRGNKRLVAYCVTTAAAPAADQLKAWVSSKLPEYMVPSAFVMLDTLPLTANGKVDRRQLPEPPSISTGPATPVAGGAAADTDIARIVSGLLGAQPLEVSANLLQLGATSIEMIRIANALDQQLGFRPRMDEFYRDPTIAGLSALFARQQPSAAAPAQASGGDPLLTPEWLLKGIPKIMDPKERDRFKASRPALRQFSDTVSAVKLPGAPGTDDEYARHRSYREYVRDKFDVAALADLLGCLRSIQLHDKPKYLYASAGGMYPVQTYLHIKPGRIAGIEGGFYYYDPAAHQLVRTGDDDPDFRRLYDPLVNRPIFDQAAFALYLIADLHSIGAMYRERALHYASLEAGHMTQLLEMRAPGHGLGLCQTGGLETDDLRGPLQLNDHSLVLHGLLGGAIGSPSDDTDDTGTGIQDERDEGEI